MPVLMVRYLASTKQLFVRWFHQYDPYQGRGGKESLTFRWEPDDVWATGTAHELAEDARSFYQLRQASLSRPRPFHLLAASDGFGFGASELNLALRVACDELEGIVAFSSLDAPQGAASGLVAPKELSVDLAKVTRATLHVDGNTYVGPGSEERIAADLIILLALAYERLGQDELVSQITTRFFARSSLIADPEASFALSASMARAGRVREALQLSTELDDPDNDARSTAAFILGLAALLAPSLTGQERNLYETTLKQRVKRRASSHQPEAGVAAMNLAAFLRSQQRFDKAVNHYVRAAQLNPDYLARAHYWFEYGGALWGTWQFSKAVAAYERSLEFGTQEPLARALLADCLMYAGRYVDALSALRAFTAEHPEADDGEYRLKVRGLAYLVDRLGVERQERHTHKALNVGRGVEPRNSEEWVKLSVAQLREDAIWGSAWLNLGVAEEERGDVAAALNCHVVATLLTPLDTEAWSNATLCALVAEEPEVCHDLIVAGYRLAGSALVKRLTSRSKKTFESPLHTHFVEFMNACLDDRSEQTSRGIVMRLLGERGEVDERFLTSEPPLPPQPSDV